MTINTSSKEQALHRALEMIEARVRFNIELKIYVTGAPDLETKDFLCKQNAGYRDFYAKHSAYSAITQIAKTTFIHCVDDDIKTLVELGTEIKKIMQNEEHVLAAMILIERHIQEEKYKLKKLVAEELERKRQIKKQAKKDAKKAGDVRRSLVVKAALANEKVYVAANERSELFIFTDIKELLFNSNIAGEVERDFIEKHSAITFADDGSYSLRLHKSFINSITTSRDKILSLEETLVNTKVSNISVALLIKIVEEFNKVAGNFIKYYMKLCQIDSQSASSRENTADIYRYFHKSPAIISELETLVYVEIKAAQNWYVEQQRIFAVEQTQERQRQLALKAQQQEQIAAEKKQLLQDQERKLAEFVKQRNLDLTKRREQIEAERVLREVGKRKQRILTMRQTVAVYSDTDGNMTSKFKLPMEIVLENIDEIELLLDMHTKAYPYRQAVNLIRRLGGEVDTSTGSSHQVITFNGSLYNYIETETEPEIAVSSTYATAAGDVKVGMAKPHAGETDLRNHNLKLVRDAISSVLPNGWRELSLTHAAAKMILS